MKVSEQNLCDVAKEIIESGTFDSVSCEKNAISVYTCAQPYVDIPSVRKTVAELFPIHNLAYISANDVSRCIRTYLRNDKETDSTDDNLDEETNFVLQRLENFAVTNDISSLIESSWYDSKTVDGVIKQTWCYAELQPPRTSCCVVVATHPAFRRLNMLDTYYTQLKTGLKPAMLNPAMHERAIENLPDILKRITTLHAFDRLIVLSNMGNVIYDGSDGDAWYDAWWSEFSHKLTDAEETQMFLTANRISVTCERLTPQLSKSVDSICALTLTGSHEAMHWVAPYVRNGVTVCGHMRKKQIF